MEGHRPRPAGCGREGSTVRIVRVVLLAVAGGFIAGCSGAKYSLAHYSEDLGQIPPAPQSGGAGPPGIRPTLTALPESLADLLDVYRRRLVETAHPLAAELAEQYAATEIANLRRHYDGREEALGLALRSRLRAPVFRPLVPAEVDPKGGPFPPGEQAGQAGQGRGP